MRVGTRVILPIAAGLVGALWVAVGLATHQMWIDNRPGSGFYPALVGALLVLMSVLALLNEAREKPPVVGTEYLLLFLAVVAVVVAALLIGFFPALALFVLIWLKWVEGYAWPFSLITTAASVAALYGIFAVWLQVPVPNGAIVGMIIGR